jgi:hypothetical protein
MAAATGKRRRCPERASPGHGADTAGIASGQLAVLESSAAVAAAKRLKLGEKDEDDLLAHLGVAYEMEMAASCGGYAPAQGGDDKKIGGGQSGDAGDLDLPAIAAVVLSSLKRKRTSTHHDAPEDGDTSVEPDGEDEDLLKHLDEACDRENALRCGALGGGGGTGADHGEALGGGDRACGALGGGVCAGTDHPGGDRACGACGGGVCAGADHGGALGGGDRAGGGLGGGVCVREEKARSDSDHYALFDRSGELDV